MTNRERAIKLASDCGEKRSSSNFVRGRNGAIALAANVDLIETALDEAWERGAQSIKHQHLWLKSTPVETFCTKCGLKWSEAGTLTESGEA